MARVDIVIGGTTEDLERAIAQLPATAKRSGQAIADAIGGGVKKAGSAVSGAFKGGTQAVEGLGKAALTSAAALGTLATGAQAAGLAYATLANNQARVLQDLRLLSDRTGIGVDTMNGLRLAANAAGKELDDVVPEDLSTRIKEAAEGTGEGADGFKLLGIAARELDGTLRSGDEVFREMLDKLAKMEDRTLANAIADDLFSDNGTRLISVLQGGTAELDAFTARGREFGYDVGPEAAARTVEWQEGVAALSLALENGAQEVLDWGAAVGLSGQNLQKAAIGLVFWTSLLSEGTNLLTETEVALARAEYTAFRFWLSFQEGGEEAEEALNDAADAGERVVVPLKGAADAAQRIATTAWAASAAVQALEKQSREFWASWVQEATAAEIDKAFSVQGQSIEGFGDALEVSGTEMMDALNTMSDGIGTAYDEVETARAEFVEKFEQWHGLATAAANALTDVWVHASQRRADAAAEAAREALSAEQGLQTELDRLNEQRREAQDESERSQLDSQIAYTAAKLADAQAFTEAQQEEALKQWKANKAAQISSATINALAAATLAFATIPWPASIFAAGAATAAALAEVAIMASEPPPEFPIGMSPDHVPVGVQPGEAVVARRGVGPLGGADAIERANRGEGPRGPGGVSVYLGRREIRDAVREVQEDRPSNRYGKGRGRR